jgi:hypothetical protein
LTCQKHLAEALLTGIGMVTIAVVFLMIGVLTSFGGSGYAAYSVWLDLRRGSIGIMAGEARWGIRVVALGGLLTTIGLVLGGWRDAVRLLGG